MQPETPIEMNPATLRAALDRLTNCLRDLWFLAPNTEQVNAMYNEASDIIYSLEVTLPPPPEGDPDEEDLRIEAAYQAEHDAIEAQRQHAHDADLDSRGYEPYGEASK